MRKVRMHKRNGFRKLYFLISLLTMLSGCDGEVSEAKQSSKSKEEFISVITTNYHKEIPQEQLFNVPQPIRILDLGYIQYTKEFAEKFGYPKQFIAKDIPANMQVIEFRMMTKGIYKECYLNVLLNGEISSDFLQQDYINMTARKERLRLPRPINDIYEDGQIQPKRFYTEDIPILGILATNNYKPTTFNEPSPWAVKEYGEGSYESLFLHEISISFFLNYYYLSFFIPCENTEGIKKFWKSDKAELWLRDQTTERKFPKSRDMYITFKIPEKIKTKILEWIEIGKFNDPLGAKDSIEVLIKKSYLKEK